jgi:hypothetical protein
MQAEDVGKFAATAEAVELLTAPSHKFSQTSMP